MEKKLLNNLTTLMLLLVLIGSVTTYIIAETDLAKYTSLLILFSTYGLLIINNTYYKVNEIYNKLKDKNDN